MDKIKVLIVDDQTLMRDGLKTILELEENIEVVGTAADGREALEKVSGLNPQIVLMDIRMPNMDGVECIKRLKEGHKDIVILMLTTFNDEEYIVEALSHGASGYILKDIEADDLIKAIYDAYKGSFILPSDVAVKLAQRLSRTVTYVNPDASNNVNQTLKPSQTSHSQNKKKSLELSEREIEVAKMLAQGFTNKQISSSLYISEGTVKNYVSNIYSKIGIGDRTAAALFLKEHL
jgi:DNA-binding NarL/FixJ family response regulator